MLTLWGRTSSINVRKALWAVQELGLACERIDAGGPFGRVRSPDYLALNPNGLVPVLVDDHGAGDTGRPGVVLWESNVIVRYLFDRYGAAAGFAPPATAVERFAGEQWMDWQQTTMNPAGRHGFLQLIRTPEASRDAAVLAASVAAMAPLLDLLDAHLARQPFMAGDRFGVADIPLGCEMHRWFGLPLARTPRPHLDRWYAGLSARPAARGVLDLALS